MHIWKMPNFNKNDLYIFNHKIEPTVRNAPSVIYGSDFKILTYDDGKRVIVDRYPCRCVYGL